MGGALSVQSDEPHDFDCDVNPNAEHSIGADISDEFRSNLHDAISDAHANTVRVDTIVLPWEMPSMAWVFGEGDPLDFPAIAPVLGYVEPADSLETTRSEPAVALSGRKTFFENAITFNSFRTCHLDDRSQHALLSQKWEALVSINYSAFDLGIQIFDAAFDEKVTVVSEVLAGKSPATLSRRLSQATRFVRWATDDAKRSPFPVSSELIKNYVRHLRNNEAGHSAFKGFVEVLKFMKHVMGLDCDLSAFDSAWVSGIMRGVQQSRPLRRQSTSLNIKTLQFLEDFMIDPQNSIVDRYASGVFLFAVYARARFGDLRRISRVIIDLASDESEGSLGYLEMHSSSHKMRATGNRLGAHLPLIAPIKGLGQHAWGHTFIELSKNKKVSLGFDTWLCDRPLLPAPTQLGDWTDRSVTTTEVGKWMHGILAHCKDFEPDGFTPHGCKATTLIMLSKYGASPDDRLVLGHHQLQKGALEVYARDLQSAPLRVLERMFRDIRCGRFSPDLTRSGMFSSMAEPRTLPMDDIAAPSPAPTTPLEDVPSEVSEAGFGLVQDGIGDDVTAEDGVTNEALPTETLAEDQVSEGSDSEFDSEESSTEAVIHELATSQRPTGHWHPGCELYQHRRSKLIHALSTFGHRKAFICGRGLSAEYKKFETEFCVDAMKCQQCDRGHAPSAEGQQVETLGRAVKRARNS